MTQTPTKQSPAPKPPATTHPPSVTPPVVQGRVVSRLATTKQVVALTFDAGSGSEAVAAIVAVLEREGVPATFFLTGEFADLHPALSARVADLGTVGNHTYTHPHLPQLRDAQVAVQLSSTRTAITRATGHDPFPLFRFPYGDYDTRTLKTVNSLGYVAVGWSVDTLGWKGRAAGVSVTQIAQRVAADRSPGQIVLMHMGAAGDHSTLDADALPRIIAEARSAGYGFTTLASLRQGADGGR